MLNFLDLCSLDIHYDLESNAILCGEHVKYLQFQKIQLKNLTPTLLNKALTYPEEVYEEYNGIFHEGDQILAEGKLSYDLIHIPVGLLGIEYIKTHIYYSPSGSEADQISSIVEVQYGTLTIILQKNYPMAELDFGARVEQAYMAHINQGEKFIIPEGFYYTFVNTGESTVIFTRAYKKYNLADYNLIKKERGLAYYCIRKNGRQEIVLNPFYRNSPAIKVIGCQQCLIQTNLDTKCSLYNLIKSQLKMLVTEIAT